MSLDQPLANSIQCPWNQGTTDANPWVSWPMAAASRYLIDATQNTVAATVTRACEDSVNGPVTEMMCQVTEMK